MSEFIKSYANLLEVDDEIEDDKEDTKESREKSDGTNQTSQLYGWLVLLQSVSDVTKLNFTQCWELDLYTFMNYAAFSKEYNRRYLEALKKARNQR